jgi:hypothetical protein
MYHQYTTCPLNKQASKAQAEQLAQAVEQFLHPLLACLDLVLDRRLVRTFAHAVMAIIVHRSRSTGLWLSELGGVVLSPEHAPAGTKRLSNLLLSPKWSSLLIDVFLWQRAQAFVKRLQEAGQPVLALWDSCVVEKPESLAAEGLCAVISEPRQAPQTDQARLFQSPHGPSDLCARVPLDGADAGRDERGTPLGELAMVDHARFLCHHGAGSGTHHAVVLPAHLGTSAAAHF